MIQYNFGRLLLYVLVGECVHVVSIAQLSGVQKSLLADLFLFVLVKLARTVSMVVTNGIKWNTVS